MKKNSVGLLELKMADLECFLEKAPLTLLGVKKKSNVSREFTFWGTTTVVECQK
jgi:hypothetical protein